MDLHDGTRVTSAYQPIVSLRPNQIIQLELEIAKFFHIPVYFEVLEVDEANLHASFGYVEGNVSQGVQDIHFKSDGEGKFVVHHVTRYKSKNSFRDRYVYPPFHKNLISGFYDRLVSLATFP
jgi:hypothetical protein